MMSSSSLAKNHSPIFSLANSHSLLTVYYRNAKILFQRVLSKISVQRPFGKCDATIARSIITI